ncbi:MAG: hypothetical protein CME62_03290 [Halobacteriovoraceae bacterium]|nr:hypothetical protein [Halobacteriovoraceae bacterium]|tara:strand:+ start:9060 stop:9596 length:537 start_codon:yes stop_codon:yes gene_type:complete
MATIFSHAIVAGLIPKFSKLCSKRLVIICILCSILPDLDVLAFKLGIAYSHPLGHRGFTHSIIFALISCAWLRFLFFKDYSAPQKRMIFILLFLSMMSHGVLDAFTNGGLGVGFFIPFDNTRYFFPTRPIQVSPIGMNFFSYGGVLTLLSEFKFIVLPVGGLLVAKLIYRKLAIKINK